MVPDIIVLKLKGSGKGGVCVWCTPFVCRWQNFVRDCSWGFAQARVAQVVVTALRASLHPFVVDRGR